MNRLAQESSPYLQQHRNNPVDWYPWGAAAWERARSEDKPVFLSIGYAACHWCHVMERESFENPRIAAVLNEHFVCVKVDREERPDVDHIYMQAVQLLGGRGGWPLSMFLTPDQQPFYGGTYWPPTARGGMPGLDQVLTAVVEAWTQQRHAALEQAAELTRHLQGLAPAAGGSGDLALEVLHAFRTRLNATFDVRYGGFGRAPKFPRSIELHMLLRLWHRDRDPHTLHMVQLTLDRMAGGGIYDHLGGGFARYAVDDRWLVPHFEKMLYDNALLAEVYLEAYQATREAEYARVARETLAYLLREMRDAAGGFHSSEDADSDGEEGRYYVWTVEEVRGVLGDEPAERFCRVYDVTPGGNFDGRNILHLSKTLAQNAALLQCSPAALSAALADAREQLRAARAKRPRPGRDDKIVLSWNALAIQALARGGVLLEEPEYLAAARGAAEFLLHDLRRADGRLLHCWCRGQAKLDAYLDDYAGLIQALVTLYESDFAEVWIDQALQLSDIVLTHFRDGAGDGAFFYTADDHERLIVRSKDTHDGSVPSSNGLLATALIRLGKLTGRTDLLDAAHGILQAVLPLLHAAPEAVAQSLLALDLWLGPTWEVVLCAPPASPRLPQVLATLRQAYVPRKVIACRTTPINASPSDALTPLFAGKCCEADEPIVFLCENFVCQAPVVGVDAIRRAWEALAAQR